MIPCGKDGFLRDGWLRWMIRMIHFANGIFLISDGEAVSTTELLQKMARALGKEKERF